MVSLFKFHLLELRFTTLLFIKTAESSRGPEVGTIEEGNKLLFNKVWSLHVIRQWP